MARPVPARIPTDRAAPPRFVILFHDLPLAAGRGPHFDWMFEESDHLRTWASESLPNHDGVAIPAVALPPHRRDYLEYQGPVSGGRGTVTRIRRGTHHLQHDTANRIVYELDQAEPDAARYRVVWERADDDAWILRLTTIPPA